MSANSDLKRAGHELRTAGINYDRDGEKGEHISFLDPMEKGSATCPNLALSPLVSNGHGWG